jgi:hypothetical protein
MAVDIYARTRFIPISAQKVRLVANMVRGKDAVEALALLKFTTNFAARPVSKVLASESAETTCIFTRSLLMKPPLASGGDLELGDVSSPG